MNSLLNICNYDCKHCSSNSPLQNWHLIFMNLLLSKHNCKYCSAKFEYEGLCILCDERELIHDIVNSTLKRDRINPPISTLFDLADK